MQPPSLQLIFGHYTVCSRPDGSPWELGRGSAGITYKAEDRGLGLVVALKVIECAEADEAGRERIRAEAQAAAKVCHGNIARIYYLGQERERLFCAMEYVEGETAQARCERLGPMEPRAALQVALDLCHALQALHREGLVHRDVRPANIMLPAAPPLNGERHPAKLIGFGLPCPVTIRCSAEMSFIGTADYASPEQIRGEPLDIRSDLYSLGCTLWSLLTGEPPFHGSVASILGKHLRQEPPWPRVDAVDPAIGGLLRQLLSKRPEDRPADPAALANSVRPLLVHEQWRRLATSGFHTPAAEVSEVLGKTSTRIALGTCAFLAGWFAVWMLATSGRSGRSGRTEEGATVPKSLASLARQEPFGEETLPLRLRDDDADLSRDTGSTTSVEDSEKQDGPMQDGVGAARLASANPPSNDDPTPVAENESQASNEADPPNEMTQDTGTPQGQEALGKALPIASGPPAADSKDEPKAKTARASQHSKGRGRKGEPTFDTRIRKVLVASHRYIERFFRNL